MTKSKTAKPPTNNTSARKGMGWIPDLPDARDFKYAYRRTAGQAELPARVDLRPHCPPVTDQGRLSSCTGHAVVGAFEAVKRKQDGGTTPLSPLFVYYCERVIEGTVAFDPGAMIRTGMKVVRKLGAAAEALWPYKPKRFKDKPSAAAYKDALTRQAVQFEALGRDLSSFRQCLAEGFPVVVGITLYAGFESDAVRKTGRVAMPRPGERMLGGHAVCVVGYDDPSGRFLVRNSWGPDWGDGGHFTLPYAYLLDPNLSRDFWMMRVVE